MSIVLFISNTIFALIAGFFIGKEWGNKIVLDTPAAKKKPKKKEMLKVLHQQPIKSFDERRQESIETGKPIIKTFYK